MTENKRFKAHIYDDGVNERYHDGIIDYTDDRVIRNFSSLTNLLNNFVDEIEGLKKENKILYDENIQLRLKLLHFHQLKDDVKYLEEKGVF